MEDQKVATESTREEIRTKLQNDGRHRVLSLDGGGIRGTLTAAVLENIEKELRNYYKCNDLRLSDFFDVVAGTSTGSLLAAGIAVGMSADELLNIYLESGQQIFTQKRKWLDYIGLGFIDDLYTKYDERPLEKKLKDILGETTFSSPEVKTKIVIVAECITRERLKNPAFSTVFFNNFGNTSTYEFSKDVKLWQACRASSAAPTYFQPMTMPTKFWDDGVNLAKADSHWKKSQFPQSELPADFIDGGISGYNNPANAILTALTSEEYGIKYNKGPENLLLVSVGTGLGYGALPQGRGAKYNAIDWAKFIVDRLMAGAAVHQSLAAALKCYSVVDNDNGMEQKVKLPFGLHRPRNDYEKEIAKKLGERFKLFPGSSESADVERIGSSESADAERIGSSESPYAERIATRLRFNVVFDKKVLEGLGITDITGPQLANLAKMDDISDNNIRLLERVGHALASKYFSVDLLYDFLK